MKFEIVMWSLDADSASGRRGVAPAAPAAGEEQGARHRQDDRPAPQPLLHSAYTAWEVGLNARGVPEGVWAPGYMPST